MGICTSTARHRQKQQQHQQHNRTGSKNPIGLDIKPPPPLPPLPITVFPKQQSQYHHHPPPPLYTDFDIFSSSSSSTRHIFHQTDTNSLIQLYSSNTNNNNNNNNNSTIINWMSSSTTSSVTHIPPRIPVPKTRLPVYQPSQSQQTTVTIRPKSVTSAVLVNNQTGKTEINKYFTVYRHWTITSFSHIYRCYQSYSHSGRITEKNLYKISCFFSLPSLFIFSCTP